MTGPQIDSSYQQATGATDITQTLQGKVPANDLSQIIANYSGQEVGITEQHEPGVPILQVYVKAKALAEKTHIPQIVIFNASYFAIDLMGKVSGPLADQCQLDPGTAQEMALQAVRDGDTSLFVLLNAHLPEMPS